MVASNHTDEASLQSIKYSKGHLQLLDQRKLPMEMVYLDIKDSKDGWIAIRDMVVRGAPAIAIAAALSLAVEVSGLQQAFGGISGDAASYLIEKLDYLVSSRPTAVNLSDASTKLEDVASVAAGKSEKAEFVFQRSGAYTEAAEIMLIDDVADNKAIGSHGASFVRGHVKNPDRFSVLTHCNTGSLATAGHGTALGVIRTLHLEGVLEKAFCTETRPFNQLIFRFLGIGFLASLCGISLLCVEATLSINPMTSDHANPSGQCPWGSLMPRFLTFLRTNNPRLSIRLFLGSRLTAFELVHDNIPATLIADSAAAALMKDGRVNAVIVGADRIAANGDTANKIGTYSLALSASFHGVPFYVAAPSTSIDLSISSGEKIVIEERTPKELTHARGGQGEQVSVSGISVWNPAFAFDVTPASLITGIITEKGVITKENIDVFMIKEFLQPIPSNQVEVS